MAVRWLRRRFELSAIRSGRDSLERFIASLQGQSAAEIAILIVFATAARLKLREAGHLPDEMLGAPTADGYERATVQRRLVRLVRSLRSRNEYIDAAGAMIWLHTLRALNSPELNSLGQRLWQQLGRGQPQVPEALARLEAMTHRSLPPGTAEAARFVPPYLWIV